MIEGGRCTTCGVEMQLAGRCVTCYEVELRLKDYIQSKNGLKFVLNTLLENV